MQNLSKLQPYYQTNNKRVSLYHADAIEFLKSLSDNSIDILVTDPAYSGMNNRLKLGKGRIVGKYQDRGKKNGKWFTEFEDTPDNYELFLSECHRVINRGGHVYIMFDSFSLLTLAPLVRKHLNVKNIITWDKVDLGMGHYYRRRHEYIIFATNGNNRHIRNRSFPDVWRFKRIHSAKYPTQKPVELFQSMIYASCNLEKSDIVVCDPFTGSSSSALAALKNKCIFIGADISIKAMNISKLRIEKFLTNSIDPLQTQPSFIPGEKQFWNNSNG
jgi:site-specific DNA-methyltransferase (adenine-specific)